MNHFLELKIFERARTVLIRPEHVAAIEHRDDDPYVRIYMVSGDIFLVEPGQFSASKLVNRTTHAGMRVLK